MKTKGNLIPSIGAFCILLASMTMTGCMAPLGSAAMDGDINVVKRLLNEGANVDAKIRNQYTALSLAAMYGHAETAKLLIEKGADIDKALPGLERDGDKAGVKLLERIREERKAATQPQQPSQVISKEDLKTIVQAAVEGAKTQKESKPLQYNRT